MTTTTTPWPVQVLNLRYLRLRGLGFDAFFFGLVLFAAAFMFCNAGDVWRGAEWPSLIHIPDNVILREQADATTVGRWFGAVLFAIGGVLLATRRMPLWERRTRLVAGSVCMFMLGGLLFAGIGGAWQPRQDGPNGRGNWVSFDQMKRLGGIAPAGLPPAQRQYVELQFAVLAGLRRGQTPVAASSVARFVQGLQSDPQLAAAVAPSWRVRLERMAASVDPQIQPSSPSGWARGYGTALRLGGIASGVIGFLLMFASLPIAMLVVEVGNRRNRVARILQDAPGVAESLADATDPLAMQGRDARTR